MEWFARRPDIVRGASWMLVACLFFSLMSVIVKILGHTLDSLEIVFFRNLFALGFVLPMLLRLGPGVLKTRRLGAHLRRGLFAAAAMTCGFYAVTQLPLADATVLSFTKPFFLIGFAALFLGEKVRWRRTLATLAGFAGVLIMLRPGTEAIPIAALVSLLGAALVAAGIVQVKDLSRTEQSYTILVYSLLASTVATVIPALFVWRNPSLLELALLGLVGGFGAIGQFCAIRAYSAAETTAVAPFDYSRLIYATWFGFLFFAEVPTSETVAGALVIVASTAYIARREAKLGHRRAAASEGG
jgi:drug/metabolite transporter (DMT)-like permease